MLITKIGRALIGGTVATLAALCLVSLADPWGIAIRMSLLFMGQLLAWASVALRLRDGMPDLNSRLLSGGMVAWAASLLLVAGFAVGSAWQSGAFLLHVLSAVAFLAAGIVCLSSLWRRIVVSVLVVLHFGGILIAIASVSPGSGRAPWLASQLWAYCYRPYLQFMNLSESYHLFSPEPIETPFVWFHLRYADRTGRWVKMPRRDEVWNGLDLHRHMKLVENTGFHRDGPEPFVPDVNKLFARRSSPGRNVPLTPTVFVQLVPLAAPQSSGFFPLITTLAVGTTAPNPIPTPYLSPTDQYAEPTAYSRWVLGCCVRHIARTHPTSANGKPLVEVLVYRGRHRCPLPEELAAGLDPRDESLYQPFFMGQYRPQPGTGQFELTSRIVDFDPTTGQLLGKDPYEMRDPLLYWLVPIVHEETPDQSSEFEPFPLRTQPSRRIVPPRTPLRNYVRLHAGDFSEKEPGW